MQPRIFDRSFKYTPSAKTDIAKTFKRIKRELASNCISTLDNTSQMHIPSEFLGISSMDEDELVECQHLLRADMFFNYPY